MYAIKFFLDNPLYLLNAGFSHIPCPVCTSQYWKHFDSDYLEIDYWDNTAIAADLWMHLSLINEFMDEDNFRTTIYDTGVHVYGRECLPLSSREKVRNIYNVFLRMCKQINIICAWPRGVK